MGLVLIKTVSGMIKPLNLMEFGPKHTTGNHLVMDLTVEGL